ncbi:MAG: AAA family ATPase [Rickettsiales bacterium TMED254]|nr:MAG: AAA family ATPase [Rickettsiales bacterium TMED254]|tara:strand:- start:1096 stop:2034 length:939 start_codon:yes stop_codon:yes gene_type:complete
MSVDFLWVEKYRPQTIEDVILPERLKKPFELIAESGKLPNMLFTGTAGTGKTTVAKALCKQLNLDYIIINASEDGNIDTLRTKIKQFASSVSLQGGYKVVILDEADYLNAQSTQPALRGFIEEFSKNCRFILTCNFKNRIIEPLHSRCSVYEFNSNKKELVTLAEFFMKRLINILNKEQVKYDDKSLVELIMKHAPDWRRIINELQKLSYGGIFSFSNSINVSSDVYSDLFVNLKDKDFKKMRSWVVNNIDVDAAAIFRGVYDRMADKVSSQSIPQLVLILADYQYKNAFAADHELNVVACLTEIMANVEFK